jgi:hypothetical protein
MLFPPVIVSILPLLGMIALLPLKLMGSYSLAWLGYFVGSYLQLKLQVVLVEHWIAEIEFASIAFCMG